MSWIIAELNESWIVVIYWINKSMKNSHDTLYEFIVWCAKYADYETGVCALVVQVLDGTWVFEIIFPGGVFMWMR